MTSLILLNHLVPDIDILKNAIKVPYVESEQLVSDIIDSDSGTHELDQNIVNNISNLDSSITTIALLYENIAMIPDGFEELCSSLPQHVKTIDLLTCNLNDEESITILKTLESRYNKTIRYSVDLTGHEDSMGNWVLESHNVSVRDKYFNNMITEWKHVLSTITDYTDSVYQDVSGKITAVKWKPTINYINPSIFYNNIPDLKTLHIPSTIPHFQRHNFNNLQYLDTIIFENDMTPAINSGADQGYQLGDEHYNASSWQHRQPFIDSSTDSSVNVVYIILLRQGLDSNIQNANNVIFSPESKPRTYIKLSEDNPPYGPNDFSNRNLAFTNFTNINLSGAKFHSANLFQVNLTGAKLNNSDLRLI
jgi:hypothetical protein